MAEGSSDGATHKIAIQKFEKGIQEALNACRPDWEFHFDPHCGAPSVGFHFVTLFARCEPLRGLLAQAMEEDLRCIHVPGLRMRHANAIATLLSVGEVSHSEETVTILRGLKIRHYLKAVHSTKRGRLSQTREALHCFKDDDEKGQLLTGWGHTTKRITRARARLSLRQHIHPDLVEMDDAWVRPTAHKEQQEARAVNLMEADWKRNKFSNPFDKDLAQDFTEFAAEDSSNDTINISDSEESVQIIE